VDTPVQRSVLLDVTRLISRSWTRRRSTGIDRVCSAYLAHFRDRAQAVVQYRGVIRLLDTARSDILFDLLQRPEDAFRREILRMAPEMLLTNSFGRFDGGRAFYLNTSHTDFDLPAHVRWARTCDLRPIYFLHDLIPITHAPLCRPYASRRHYGRVVSALTNATGIIVNSQWTSAELATFASQKGLKLPPVVAASLSGADIPAPQLKASNDAGAKTRPYFVCVGTIEPRKNHVLLLKVWTKLIERLGEDAPELRIIGQWGRGSREVRRMLGQKSPLGRYVRVVNNCPDLQMAEWISGAQALLCPTLAEGFGLPLVEALKLGTPVIASDIASFREIGQGIPLLLNPDNVPQWESSVIEFLGNSRRKSRQVEMMGSFKPYTWRGHFQTVDSWMTQLSAVTPPLVEEKKITCIGA